MDIRIFGWEIIPPSLVRLPGNSRAEANHPDRRRQWSRTERKGAGGMVVKGLQTGVEGLRLMRHPEWRTGVIVGLVPWFKRINRQNFFDFLSEL